MSREKTEVIEKSPERRIAPGNCRRQQGYHIIVVYNGYIFARLLPASTRPDAKSIPVSQFLCHSFVSS